MSEKVYRRIFSEYPGKEGDLVPLLQKVQGKFGYISEESVSRISRFLRLSENKIFGVASFYAQFRFTEPGRNSIKVCQGTACHVRGGRSLQMAVQKELGIKPGETTEDKRFDFDRVACLGCCALAPVVQINDDVYSRMTTMRLKQVLGKYE